MSFTNFGSSLGTVFSIGGPPGPPGPEGPTGPAGPAGPAPTGNPGNLVYLVSSDVAGSTSNVSYVADGTLSVSNSITTTNIFANNLTLSNTVFIGNTFWTGTNSTNNVVGAPNRLVFDNTTTPYAANKILLHSNTASANICGFGVVGVYDAIPMTLGYYTSGEHSFTVGANQNFGGSTAFTIRSTGSIDMNGNKRAKLDIGTFGMPSSNTTVRIDGSNVALVTSDSGLVGFGTTVPTANLHVIGNIYASNAITTTNLFATGNTSSISNMVIRSFDFVVAATAGSYSNVCSIIDVPNGSAIYAIYVDMMARGAGGSAQTKTYIIVSNYNATSGTWTRALPIGNPAAGGQTGLDVMTLNGTTYLRATNRNAAETVNVGMVVKVSSSSFSRVAITDLTSQTGTGATSSGFYPTTLVTQVANRVGVSVEVPTANLHVVGNVYVSNAVTATNVFATAGASIGPSVLGTNVFVFSNTSGGSNVLIMNNLGRVGIATTSPGYPLDVGTTVSIAASGNETIRSKGPVIIGNGTNDGNRFISALDSSMVGGDSRYFVLGKAGSIYNQAELSYYHDGDGSTNNKMYLGFFSKIVMTLAASGNVGIGTLVPSANVHVIGNVYVSNAVTTTNVFAATETLTGATGQTTSTITGNVYVSNALTTTNVFAATVSTTNPVSFRNRVINGDFYIDQRNSSASSTPAAGVTRPIDRWKVEIFGSGRCLVGQNLGAFASPVGFTSYYGMKVTTTTTVGAGDYFFLSQLVEGVNTIDWNWGTSNARPVTISFWVQSSLTGTAGGFVRNSGSTAGNYTRSYPFTFTINNALTWEYKTITIPGDTTGQWINGQVDGVEFGIELWNGSTYQASPGAWAAGNYTGPSGGTINYAGTLNSNMNITGVQIELGNVATPWERRHYGFELAMCQRYYETAIARLGGYHTTGNYLRSSVYFNTKKRPAASPTFTVISTPESNNLGSLNLDNSNFDGSSARILAQVTTTGDAFGQWSVSVDCEF